MNLKELYVKETGNQAIIDDDYFDWLEQKAEEGQRAVETMGKVLRLYHASYYGGDVFTLQRALKELIKDYQAKEEIKK